MNSCYIVYIIVVFHFKHNYRSYYVQISIFISKSKGVKLPHYSNYIL